MYINRCLTKSEAEVCIDLRWLTGNLRDVAGARVMRYFESNVEDREKANSLKL